MLAVSSFLWALFNMILLHIMPPIFENSFGQDGKNYLVMTEESFQQCRKLMQKANWLRGRITNAKANVGKWTKIEDTYRNDLKESQAIGASKMLDKAMTKLQEYRDKFAAMKFPDSDIVVEKRRVVQCDGCGASIVEGNTYCGECLCEDDSDY